MTKWAAIVIDAYERGYTVEEIAELVGDSEYEILDLLLRNGYEIDGYSA